MAILSKGTTFTSPQQVTSTNLNNLVDAATFVSGSSGTTDDSTLEVNGSGRLQMKDGGTTAAKLASNSVTTAKVADGNITFAKLSTGAPTWNGTDTVTISFADQDSTLKIVNTESTSQQFPRLEIDNYSDTYQGSSIVQLRTARGNSATPSAVQSTDTLGQLIFSGHDGSDFQQVGRVQMVATENFSGTQTGAAMTFRTNINGATVDAERMRISETGGLLIGTATDIPSAILTLSSTTKGFRPPVMTTTQRNAMSSPAEGLMVYNSTTKKLNFYNGTAWEAVTSA